MSLSRRDHFALAAMQGLLAEDSQFQLTDDKLAKWAVTQADALIAELDRTAPAGSEIAKINGKGAA